MKKIIQLLILLMFISCTTSKVITTNLQDLSSFETDAQVYVLPKTTFIFEVTATRHSFQPGPYNKYAKKFLGIDGTKSISEVYWQLENVDIKQLVEPDVDQYYSVKFTGKIPAENPLFELGKNGLILSHDMIPSYKHYNSDVIDKVEEIHFTDLTISSFINDDTRKKPKNSPADSEFEGIPSWQKHIAGKTMEEKAFEASKFIFKIRKRRFKLLSGQYEVFPEGIALETSIKELNKLEESYLSLFIGKSEADTIKRIFTYTPVNNQPLQRINLFRFSDETGFYTSTENQGNPIILEVQDLEENKKLSELQIPLSEAENILLYRIPDKASVKLLYGSYELMQSIHPVFQFGVFMPLYISQCKTLLSRDR